MKPSAFVPGMLFFLFVSTCAFAVPEPLAGTLPSGSATLFLGTCTVYRDFPGVGRSILGFNFLDSDNRSLPAQGLVGRVVVLVGGGRKSSEPGQPWEKAMVTAFGDDRRIALWRLAEMSALPGFLRFIVQPGMKRGEGPLRFLFDWKGVTRGTLVQRDMQWPNIFVIDPSGCVRLRIIGAYGEQGFAALRAEIERHLPSATAPPPESNTFPAR